MSDALKKRIEHLEEVNGWRLFSPDLVNSMVRIHGGGRGDSHHAAIFETTREVVDRVLDPTASAFFCWEQAAAVEEGRAAAT